MIKAIFFDLDNTLIDFVKMKRLSCEQAISAMIDSGLDIKKGQAMKILFALYDKYGWENQRIFQHFLHQTVGKVDYRVLSAGIVAYRRVKEGFLDPYPHVTLTLLKLKQAGYKLGILSDAPRIQAWIRLAAMKLQHSFDWVLAWEDTRKKKITGMPFELCLKRTNLKPEEILLVGDSLIRDIEGAHKVGMKTALAKYGGTKRENSKTKPDYYLDDISDLLKILSVK